MGDDRPAVYREGNTWIIRASALGGCMRSLVAAGREIEAQATPDWLQEKFDEGHRGEDAIRQKYHESHQLPKIDLGLTPASFTRDDGQWKFDLPVTPNIIVRGHLDDIGAEYKLLAPSTYAKAVHRAGDESRGIYTIPTYPWQLGCYMAATGLDRWDWVCVEKNEDGTPNLDTMHITSFGYAPKELDEIVDRCVDIVGWIEEKGYDEYPPCPDTRQYPCPYFLLEDEVEIEELTGIEAAKMGSLVQALADIKSKTLRLEADKKNINAAIKGLLGDRKTVGLYGTRITWVHTETPAHMVTPKPYMKKASVSDYPKITPPKDPK